MFDQNRRCTGHNRSWCIVLNGRVDEIGVARGAASDADSVATRTPDVLMGTAENKLCQM